MKKIKKSENKNMIFIKKLFFKLKKFWVWTWNSNSFSSYISAFILGFLIIKFLVFPMLGIMFNTNYPIVAIVTSSMEHKINSNMICGKNYYYDDKIDFDKWFEICGDYYVKNHNITKDKFENFEHKNGLYVGDVLILNGWKNKKNLEVGDTIVFEPQDKVKQNIDGLEKNKSFFLQTKGPVIHRVVDKFEENGITYYSAKGDNNLNSKKEGYERIVIDNKVYTINFDDFETKIREEDVIGVPLIRIPYLGYPKIILSKLFM